MATNDIALMGAVYPDVPQVVLPVDGGGTATFTDVSDSTVTASDVLNSKYFYDANGTKTQGTATAGVDCPTFTLTFNETATVIQSVTCDKTYAECGTYRQNGMLTAVVIMTSSSFDPIKVGATSNASSGTLYYYVSYGDAVASVLIQYTSSTLTATLDPVPYRESTDLSASNLTVTAPAGYYESNATKTLTDANLIAGNIKNGISIFGVTGTYQGSGGLVYETGTYTPASNTAQPTISFANTHTTIPMYFMMADATGTYSSTTQAQYLWTFNDHYGLFGNGFMPDSSTTRYATIFHMYRGNSSTSMSTSFMTITDPNTSSSTDSTKYGYYVTTSSVKPYTGSNSRYWRSGRTYKWIAVWAPTT